MAVIYGPVVTVKENVYTNVGNNAFWAQMQISYEINEEKTSARVVGWVFLKVKQKGNYFATGYISGNMTINGSNADDFSVGPKVLSDWTDAGSLGSQGKMAGGSKNIPLTSSAQTITVSGQWRSTSSFYAAVKDTINFSASIELPPGPSLPTLSELTLVPSRTSINASFSVLDSGGATITDSHIDLWTNSSLTSGFRNIAASTSGTASGLAANTSYWFRGNSANSVGRVFTAVKSATTTGNAPVINRTDVSKITRTTATITASSISFDNNAVFRSGRWDYGTTQSYGKTSYINEISGLIPNTRYYYKGTVTDNWNRTSGAKTGSFTTTGNAPVINSAKVSNITPYGASISGRLSNVSYDTNASYASERCDYGVTTSYGSSTTNGVLSSLRPNTTYYYRLYVRDNWGRLSAGKTGSFKTLPEVVPIINSAGVRNITRTSGELFYNVTYPEGSSFKSLRLEYGKTKSYGTVQSTPVMSGLEANTVYYYRFTVTDTGNRRSLAYEGSFVTSGNPPIVEIYYEEPSQYMANIYFGADFDTNASFNSVRIDYGTTTDYGSSKTSTDRDYILIEGLAPDVTYYYKITVTDDKGRSGYQKGFFTTLPGSEVINIEYESEGRNLDLTLEIKDPKDESVVYVTLYAEDGITFIETKVISSGAAEFVTTTFSGLTPLTTYWVEAFVENSEGSHSPMYRTEVATSRIKYVEVINSSGNIQKGTMAVIHSDGTYIELQKQDIHKIQR